MSVQGKRINVFQFVDHYNYFTVAKNAVYGASSFIKGDQYRELQELLNDHIRVGADHSGAALLKWSDDCPPVFRRLHIKSGAAFNRDLQPYLKLTHRGEGRLQKVLIDFYQTMIDPQRG
jgi:hypothetical protein